MSLNGKSDTDIWQLKSYLQPPSPLSLPSMEAGRRDDSFSHLSLKLGVTVYPGLGQDQKSAGSEEEASLRLILF